MSKDKVVKTRLLTLPTDSNERKNVPLLAGCLNYFPAALAGVANVSKLGNDKHNPGRPLHHDRSKSMDHGDCILRHLTDVEDLLAAKSRGEEVSVDAILLEANQLAWRALSYAQTIHEQFGAPLAPGAKHAASTEAADSFQVNVAAAPRLIKPRIPPWRR